MSETAKHKQAGLTPGMIEAHYPHSQHQADECDLCRAIHNISKEALSAPAPSPSAGAAYSHVVEGSQRDFVLPVERANALSSLYAIHIDTLRKIEYEVLLLAAPPVVEAQAGRGEALAAMEKARVAMAELCRGERALMSIPARPDHDPDLLVGDAFRKCRVALGDTVGAGPSLAATPAPSGGEVTEAMIDAGVQHIRTQIHADSDDRAYVRAILTAALRQTQGGA